MSRVLQVPVPEPGQLVDVRRRRYVVVDIAQSPLPPDILTSHNNWQSQHLITLSSVEDDALGEELQVIWEIEPGARAIDKSPLPRPVGFDVKGLKKRLFLATDAVSEGIYLQNHCLLLLNHQRHEEEVKAGFFEQKGSKGKRNLKRAVKEVGGSGMYRPSGQRKQETLSL